MSSKNIVAKLSLAEYNHIAGKLGMPRRNAMSAQEIKAGGIGVKLFGEGRRIFNEYRKATPAEREQMEAS